MTPTLEVKATRQENARAVPRRFPSLDGLRGIAVLAVVVYHYGAGASSTNPFVHAVGMFAKVGWSGVTLFFLLSGFLITGILWDSAGTAHWWRNFAMRRALRIFPLYYASLLLILIVAAASGKLPHALHVIWIWALFLQNIPSIADFQVPVHNMEVHHYWSLAVEEQFYLVWPLLLGAVKTRKRAIALCAIVFLLSLASRIVNIAFATQPLRYEGFLLLRAGELAFGGLLAILYRSRHWHTLTTALPPLALFSGAVFSGLAWHARSLQFDGSWEMSLGLCFLTLFLGSILAWSLQPGLVQRAVSARWLQWLGSISFGVYILHMLLLPFYSWLTLHVVSESSGKFAAVRWLIAGTLTVALAWLSFHFYEAPILRFKGRFSPHS